MIENLTFNRGKNQKLIDIMQFILKIALFFEKNRVVFIQ